MENNLSLPWQQIAPGNKYEIPYNFSKLIPQLWRELAAVQTLVRIQSSRLTERQIETMWQANLIINHHQILYLYTIGG